VLQHHVMRILARTARGLNDDRRIDSAGRRHNGKRLFHIVDVERRHAVIMFGGVVEQLAQGDAGHGFVLP